MFVYNITIKILSEIEAGWVAWQKQEHIPDIMASGCFTHYNFYKLLEPEAEDEGITYIAQYFANTLNDYQKYIDETAPLLRQKAFEKWGNQFIAFRTLMQSVH